MNNFSKVQQNKKKNLCRNGKGTTIYALQNNVCMLSPLYFVISSHRVGQKMSIGSSFQSRF
jgi:hypothetical protein